MMLIGVLLSGCGPSPEEQTATAVALTAAAATSTPTITATFTITPTFTPTPTSTVTPTPTPLPFGRTVNPPVFTGNGHFYEAVTVSGGINWFDAKVAAELRTFEGMQGHLATVSSAQEDRFIAGNFPEAVAPRPQPSPPGCERPTTVENTCGLPYWLGGFQPPNSAEPNADWQWVTSEPFVYTNWAGREPNQFQGRQEDCLQPHPDLTPEWSDSSCDDRRIGGYVVEYEPTQ